MDFSIFKNKYVLTGKIVVLNALHIGSGKEKDDRDAPFISLDDNKEFYIPGSSFRGYLSTKLERFLDSGNDFKLKNGKEELNEADVKLIFGYTNLDKLETKINEKKDDDEAKKRKELNKKIQDRIKEKLGEEDLKNIKSMAGRIHISDMSVIRDVKYVTRDGIKISRDTGATLKGAKFDYDVVPAGTEFELFVEIENIEEYQLELLGLAFKDIMSEGGDLLGGKTSRGIGKCKLKDLEMKYITSDNKDELKKYIFQKEFPNIEKSPEEIFEIKNLSIE